VYAAFRRLGYAKPSRAYALCGFYSATFFCARKNAARFSSSGAKKTSLTAGTLSETNAK